MSDNGRILLIFLCNLALYFILAEVNNLLSSVALYLHLDVLLLVFFGLYLRRTLGFLFVLILGCLAGASHPAPPGIFLLGYPVLWLLLVRGQRHIARQDPTHVRTLSMTLQLVWLTFLAILLGSGIERTGPMWQRILLESALSTVAVFLLAWPWCQFQKKLLHSLGWNLEAQLRTE